jgi:uncharacterized protein involved in copper resistance
VGSDTATARAILEKVEALTEAVSRLDHHITGNGTPEKGVLIRLDRLEQRDTGRSKAIAWVLGIFGASIAGIIVRLAVLGH